MDVAVIEDAAAAESALDPVRSRLLAALVRPGSATTLGAQTGVARQKVNYHLRALERHGLVELVEERRKGNCTERVMQATAESYVISPSALPAMAPDPGRSTNHGSARWLLALGARLVQEVGQLISGAAAVGQPLATFAVDAEVRFASGRDRAGFAMELSQALEALVDKYDAGTSPRHRRHRLVVALHPSVTTEQES